MILLRIKPANMTNGQFISKVKLLPQLCAFFRIVGISSRVDSIVDNLIWCSAEHPITRILPAGKEVCSILRNAATIPKLNRIFQIPVLICIMTVSDSHRDIMPCGNLQDHRTKAILMYMDNFVFRVLIKEAIQGR